MTLQNRDRQGAEWGAYPITFVCYGTWLHGEEGAVDRDHNLRGTSFLHGDTGRLSRVQQRMKDEPYTLDTVRRQAVLKGVLQGCAVRQWLLVAAHMRTAHVHVVVQADRKPEHVMNALKAYASRELNSLNLDAPDRRRWARHGSTRYLWTSQQVTAAVHYVICEQGEPMAIYEMPSAPYRSRF